MKKVFSMFASIVCFAVLAACGSQAHAQANALTHMQFQAAAGGYQAIDLWSVRKITTTPGAQSVTDASGNVITGTLPTTSSNAWLMSQASGSMYARAGTDDVYQLANSIRTYCDTSVNKTVIVWRLGPQEVISDGCAFAIAAYNVSRR